MHRFFLVSVLFSNAPLVISTEVLFDIFGLFLISGLWATLLLPSAPSHRNTDSCWSWYLLVHCFYVLIFWILWGYFVIDIVIGFWICSSSCSLFMPCNFTINRKNTLSVFFSCNYWAVIWLLSFPVFVLLTGWFFLKFYTTHTHIHVFSPFGEQYFSKNLFISLFNLN